jgi:exodeoxyribonuclease V alpha subunit
MSEEQLYIVGTLKAIFFQNPSNFYKVLLIKVSDTNSDYLEQEIVVTGSFGDMQEDEEYRFFGHFVDHPRYGKQFLVESYEQAQPTSANGLISYLSSDKFPGIGKKTAENIIDVLGEEAIDQIMENPAVLVKVPNLNAKKQKVIVETIRQNHGMEQIIVGLSRYGFGSQLSFAIFQTYRNEALEIIAENPYQLVEDIEGIGFKKADTLAEQLGIAADSPQRIRAAIFHQVTEDANQSGDTYVEAQQLLTEVLQLLETTRPVEIAPNQVADMIIRLVEEEKIQQEATRIYENTLFYSEWGIASSIERLWARKKEIKYPQDKRGTKLRIIATRVRRTAGA